jgi:hypothetical protein
MPIDAANFDVRKSQLLGLTGIVLYALLCCALAGGTLLLSEMVDRNDELSLTIASATVMFAVAGCYMVTLLALHTIACSTLSLALRLALVFVVTYGGLRFATWASDARIEVIHVLLLLPFCGGGFFARRFRHWRTLAWHQSPRSSPLTIMSLLDVTAATALILTVVTSAIAWSEIEIDGLLCFIPGSLLMAAIGMHCWARLCVLSPISAEAESGYGIWMAVNIANAFFVFLGFVIFLSQTRMSFAAFIVAPLTVVFAHVATEIPIRWLRSCGWTMQRVG